MKNLIKKVEALSLKPEDFIIVKAKEYLDDYKMRLLADNLKGLNHNILIFNVNASIKSEEPTAGKHKVYLNNLEYLELLEKRKDLK
jgi:hypothetical protein